ncbi:MAG: HAMP domain-containing sensor histidine kinase [Bacteroidota bacterium]|nr:HAMP domain-containing sensor histidine kinase [Bacteroidota bacterium]
MPAPRSTNIKLILLGTAVVIVVATLLYTRYIVQQLLERERQVADLYAKSLEFIANTPTDQSDYSFIFNEIIQSIDFPMVLTDDMNQPLQNYPLISRNINLDSTLTPDEQKKFITAVIQDLDKQNTPIHVVLKISEQDSIVQHLHYGESEIITKLRWLPYIEIGIAGMFILIGYIGFSYIKRNEQSNIWVGMAKETAHQLGTPLSSLMGWIEMMKTYAAENPKQLSTISEMEQDLQRLQKVTERFSKIGSKPSFKEEDLFEVIQSVLNYFQQRLPPRFAHGKHIEIGIATVEHPTVHMNRELFEWVIENLIKNALDAMEDSIGKITFSITSKGNFVFIDVKDTGKGIDMNLRKDIFRPGYSTKKRGWGLGLSLSKRIIEDYHKGKLFVKESKIGKGTTFRIKLVK